MEYQTFNESVYFTLAEIMGDLMSELVNTFSQEGASQVEQMQLAFATGDHQALMVAAHTFKSSANTLGVEKLGEYSRQIEQIAIDAMDNPDTLDKTVLGGLLNQEVDEFSIAIQYLQNAVG